MRAVEDRSAGLPLPQQLVNTILFVCGVYFALRIVQEHRALRFNPPVENVGGNYFLRYKKDIKQPEQNKLPRWFERSKK